MKKCIEKEASVIKSLLSTKGIAKYSKKSPSLKNLQLLISKAQPFPTPKLLSTILKKQNKKKQSSKKNVFSLFKKRNKRVLNDLEKAIEEIQKCCDRQDFKLEHLRRILLEKQRSLRSYGYYRKLSTSSTKKQLHQIGRQIKQHYGENLSQSVTQINKGKTKDPLDEDEWPLIDKRETNREYVLTRITDFNKTR